METRVNGAEVQARGSRKRRQEGRRHSRNKGRERLEARMDKAVPGHIISFVICNRHREGPSSTLRKQQGLGW